MNLFVILHLFTLAAIWANMRASIVSVILVRAELTAAPRETRCAPWFFKAATGDHRPPLMLSCNVSIAVHATAAETQQAPTLAPRLWGSCYVPKATTVHWYVAQPICTLLTIYLARYSLYLTYPPSLRTGSVRCATTDMHRPPTTPAPNAVKISIRACG